MEELKIYFCGREKCAPAHSFGPAVRSEYLIHFVINGKGKFCNSEKTYYLSKGQFFLIKPNEITYYEADKYSPWEYAWISLGGERAQDILRLSGLLNNPIGKTDNINELILRVSQLIDVYDNEPQNQLEQLHYAYGVFSVITPNNNNIDKHEKTYLKQAVRFINYNFAFNIKITDISNSVGIDRTYLYKLFLDKYGISPKKYLTIFRLNKAAGMLLNTDMNISEIAASCGFPDLPSFSRQFKSKYNITPNKYKKQ